MAGNTNSPNTQAANKTAPTGQGTASENLLKATARVNPFGSIRGGGQQSVPLSAAAAARRKAGA